MFDDNHGGVEFGFDAFDEGAEGFGFSLGDAGGRFVEAEDGLVEGDEPCEFDDAAGTGGEVGDVVARVGSESEEPDDVVSERSLLALALESARETQRGGRQARWVASFGRDLDGLSHGEVGKQRCRLERPSESAPGALSGRRPRDVLAEQGDLALRWYEPADGVQQRGLAGTVGADQADGLAWVGNERGVVDGDAGIESDGDVPCGEGTPVVVAAPRAS